MRVRSFFALYNEGNKLQAKNYLELLKINRIKYEFMEATYLGIINPNVKKLPVRPQRPGLDLAEVETKNQIINFFARTKRGPRGRQ